jgi:Tfp pilus assembly pilus retraction ATPase PilT
MKTFPEIIKEAIDLHAGYHLSSGIPPSCRVYGSIRKMGEEKLTRRTLKASRCPS